MPLTQEQLKRQLKYNPDTGDFTAVVQKDSGSKAAIGSYINKYGCVVIQINGVKYLAHRLAFLYMTGEWPAEQVNHINGIFDDNAWSNLKASANNENQTKTGKSTDKTCGVTGVRWLLHKRKWSASIQVDGKPVYLYLGDSEEDAIAARKKAELDYGMTESKKKVGPKNTYRR